METGTNSTTLTARLLILNPGEYDLWLMRIEQYFLMVDYSLWEVILNGNKVLKITVGETKQEYKPTTAEEKHDRRNEMKARGTLLMALPNKDQLKFHSYKDAKLLMEAIEKRYGGNKESKKLEIQGEVITQEDMNLKLLRSLPSEWKTHALIWMNKDEIETISLDDFTNSTNESDNTAYEVSAAHTQCNPTSRDNLSVAMICAFLASQPNSPQLAREDLEQIDHDDLEEMDLQWEMVMLIIRVRRFIQRTGRKLDVNGQRVGFDKTKVECYNCHKNGHFARDCHPISMGIPVKNEHKAYWALKQCNMYLIAAAKKHFMELNELMELRDGAYENTRIYMERTKKWHDSRLRGDKDFKNGEKDVAETMIWYILKRTCVELIRAF
ncbi:ubiquitin-activating enzyme E1 1-like protein isoform X2 [Tanacetum coccineum]